MENDKSEPSVAGITWRLIVFTIAHGLILAIGIIMLLYLAPIIAGMLADMTDGKMQLPVMTRLILNLSQFAVKLSYICVLIGFIALVVIVSIYYLLLRFSGKRPAGIWSVFVLFGEGSFMIMGVIALLLPLIQITEALK